MSFKSGSIKNWLEARGDETLRIDYPFNKNSIVIDAGAYEGHWSEKIYKKYECTIYAYEPIKKFYEISKETLKNYSKVLVINAAIGKKHETIEMSVLDDGSSSYKQGDKKELVKVNPISEILCRDIDLLKMNIEGGEYDIMDEIICTNKISSIKNYQIQFHKCVNNYEKKYLAIQEHLTQTHELTYYFPFVWENWRLK